MKKIVRWICFCLSAILLFMGVNVSAATAPIATSDSYRSGPYYQRLLNALDACANSPAVDRFVAVALSQEGYKADSTYGNNSGNGNANGAYCEYTNPNTIGGYGADWCAAFISWSARMAGLAENVIPTTRGAGTFRSVGTQHRLWSDDFSTYIDYRPRKGDIILNMPDNSSGKYNSWTLTAHVAIIAEDSTTRASDGGWLFTTIERSGQQVKKNSGSSYNTKRTFSNANASNVHMYQMIVTPNWPEPSDTQSPTISNVRVTDVSADRYKVTCTVTDNVGVTRVAFPTWTEPNGQDDLGWIDGEISGNTATIWIYAVNHNNERGCNYITHIYAYDGAGNWGVANTDQYSELNIYVPAASYTITLDPNGGTVSRTSLPVGLNRGDYWDISWGLPSREGYEFEGWYTSPSGGTQVYNKQGYCTNEGQYWSNNYYVYHGNVTLYAHWKQTTITPGSCTLYVTAGNCLEETAFSWTDAEHADYYDFRIYNADRTQTLYTQWSIKGNTFGALLPPGNYQAGVSPVNATYSTWTNSNFVSFTVTSASAGSSGSLAAYREAEHRLYCVYDKTCSWLEAEAIANRDAGSFASIPSQTVQNAVAQAVAEFGHPCWIGGETYRNKQFKWVNGDAFTYTNWGDGEPNGGTGIENCLEMVVNGEWNDYRAASTTGTDYYDVCGYVLQCEPVSVMISPIIGEWEAGTQLTKEDLSVTVTFENGVMLETSDFTLRQSGTGAGDQTITVTYGNLSDTANVHFVAPFGTPELTLPENLQSLEEEAFAGGTMRSVECPEGLQRIGKRAFADCTELEQILIPETVTFIGEDAFASDSNLVIYCYAGSEAEIYAVDNGIRYILIS